MSDSPTRFCPICERQLDAATCPTDGVPTVRSDFDRIEGEDDALGRTIAGRYEVQALIGQGASGRVYRARDACTGAPLALKLLQPQHARDRSQVRRFYREARAAMRLLGAHVVAVHDFGVDDDTRTPFIAMELLSGETLRDHLALHGPLHPRRAAAIGAQIARALATAAERGIVHRDLKPANIMLVAGEGEAPLVKVTDFGVAKDLAATRGDTLTADGAAVGTPAYMSPEQASGAEVGPAADLYALGCILYELLAGRPPFLRKARADLFVEHLLTPAPALPDPLPCGVSAPPALARIVARLLAKQPRARALDAGEVARSLAIVATGGTPEARGRLRWWLVAAGLALSASVLALALPRDAAPALVESPASERGAAALPADGDPIGELVVRGGAATIRLHQGPARAMQVTGDAALVGSEVDGARLSLTIGLASAGAGGLVVDLWSPRWRALKVTGAATITSVGALQVSDAALNIAGSARAELDVQGAGLTTSLRGSSELVLRGRVTRHEARTGGAARLDAAGLETDETSLTASGSSDAVVRAANRLEARNDGAGEVRYYGEPTHLTREGPGILPAGAP